MTPVGVRCVIIVGMGEKWTEYQLISFVKEHGCPTFTERTLKRYRAQKVIEAEVEHPGFGGTVTWYTPEAGQRALAVCRLLKQKRNFDVVRFHLWLENQPVEVGLLKASIWGCTPFANWRVPQTGQERRKAARELSRLMIKGIWQSVRSNVVRKWLQQFEQKDDQDWFIRMETQLLCGVPLDFTRTLLNEHDPDLENILEEPADIFAHGLQIRQIRTLPKDMNTAAMFQDMADRQLFSWIKLRTVLFAATEEELLLARERLPLLAGVFEILGSMGALGKLYYTLIRHALTRPGVQSLFFLSLLVLEQHGYGQNIDELCSAVRSTMPYMKRAQRLREALQDELPALAQEVLPLAAFGQMLADESGQQLQAYFARVRLVYETNKEALDAFWLRHPDLREDETL